jgi:hypothetical protein
MVRPCLLGFFAEETLVTEANVDDNLPEERRKEIFLALVDAQDHDMSVAQSRKMIADKFGLSEGQVRQIEREGLEQEWPPL